MHSKLALGKLLQSAEDEYALLLAENKTLKADILERSHALECEWLGFTESICARVDALYHRLNKFHQEFRTEYLEFTYKHSIYYDSNNYYGLESLWEFKKRISPMPRVSME